MSRRRIEGDETWFRLREWNKGQAPAERLAAHILRVEGFTSIDPIHPLGGRDGLKDVICERKGERWIGACYFPRGQQSFKAIGKKFSDDLKGVAKNNVEGMAFITNQELTQNERKKLKEIAGNAEIEIFHLERIASTLDSPNCYGLRLEYLDIEMSKEEQLSLITERDSLLKDVKSNTELIISLIKHPDQLKGESRDEALKILKAFRFLLDDTDINRSHYRSLIKNLYETLDAGILSLIESNTFEEFIERSTGAKLKIREFPEEWEDNDKYFSRTKGVTYMAEGPKLFSHAISKDRRLELDQTAMKMFNNLHNELMAAINDGS